MKHVRYQWQARRYTAIATVVAAAGVLVAELARVMS